MESPFQTPSPSPPLSSGGSTLNAEAAPYVSHNAAAQDAWVSATPMTSQIFDDQPKLDPAQTLAPLLEHIAQTVIKNLQQGLKGAIQHELKGLKKDLENTMIKELKQLTPNRPQKPHCTYASAAPSVSIKLHETEATGFCNLEPTVLETKFQNMVKLLQEAQFGVVGIRANHAPKILSKMNDVDGGTVPSRKLPTHLCIYFDCSNHAASARQSARQREILKVLGLLRSQVEEDICYVTSMNTDILALKWKVLVPDLKKEMLARWGEQLGVHIKDVSIRNGRFVLHIFGRGDALKTVWRNVYLDGYPTCLR